MSKVPGCHRIGPALASFGVKRFQQRLLREIDRLTRTQAVVFVGVAIFGLAIAALRIVRAPDLAASDVRSETWFTIATAFYIALFALFSMVIGIIRLNRP